MNAETIINYLEMVANHNLLVNFSMHQVTLTALVAIFVIKRENLKTTIFHAVISTLFLSVTVNAVIFGNLFHSVTFGILALTALVQLFVGKNNIRINNSKRNIVIALMFVFIGFWYPEFVEKNALVLLIVSPVGVIPCPTLLTTIGLMMMVKTSLSKIQYLITLIMGLLYGFIGVFAFKVYLDITLLVLVLYCLYNYFFSKTDSLSKTVIARGTKM